MGPTSGGMAAFGTVTRLTSKIRSVDVVLFERELTTILPTKVFPQYDFLELLNKEPGNAIRSNCYC